MVFYKENNHKYLLLINPVDRKVISSWDADKIDSLDLLDTIDDDILLMSKYSNRTTFYRYSLSSTDEKKPDRIWKIGDVNNNYHFTENILYVRPDRSSRIEKYSLETGEMVGEIPITEEYFWGFMGNGYYTAGNEQKNLIYNDLTGNKIWNSNIERVVLDFFIGIDGYSLLINKSEHEVFCLDDKGTKLWRQTYPEDYLAMDSNWIFRAGDSIVFSDEYMTTYIDSKTGDIMLNTAPGFEYIPPVIYQNTLIKITPRPDYNNYGGTGDTVELFDFEQLHIKKLLLTPESIITDPRPVPGIDNADGIAYLPLKKDRLIGIDIATGDIKYDFVVKLFEDSSGW